MSKIFNSREEDDERVSVNAIREAFADDGDLKKIRVDGYNVNHYHDGDIPVYEIKDAEGNVINIAHSTSEMHEFTSGREDDED